MTHKDIECWKTYSNSKGQTRIVIGMNQDERDSEILYRDQDFRVRVCLGSTFIRWLKG
jgi:hypothetical protein